MPKERTRPGKGRASSGQGSEDGARNERIPGGGLGKYGVVCNSEVRDKEERGIFAGQTTAQEVAVGFKTVDGQRPKGREMWGRYRGRKFNRVCRSVLECF